MFPISIQAPSGALYSVKRCFKVLMLNLPSVLDFPSLLNLRSLRGSHLSSLPLTCSLSQASHLHPFTVPAPPRSPATSGLTPALLQPLVTQSISLNGEHSMSPPCPNCPAAPLPVQDKTSIPEAQQTRAHDSSRPDPVLTS